MVLGFTFSLVLFRDSILTKNVDFCIFKFGSGKMKKPEQETLTVHKQEQEIFWFLVFLAREIKPWTVY